MLDANIPFYAALGNHDDPNQRFYKNFGMGGKRFYTYQKKDVRFFASTAITWTRTSSAGSKRAVEVELEMEDRLLPPSALLVGAAHGSEVDLRSIVEPLFIKYNLHVVFAGHEHFYERIKPQTGIYYFTAGGSAKLRGGDIISNRADREGLRHRAELHVVEIDGDVLRFQTISRAASASTPAKSAAGRRHDRLCRAVCSCRPSRVDLPG
jgi:hypothetical protein